MGHKVSPVGFRIGVKRDWNSRWYADNKNFSAFLLEDIKLREYVSKVCFDKGALLSHVEIERKKNNDASYKLTVKAFVGYPGILNSNGSSEVIAKKPVSKVKDEKKEGEANKPVAAPVLKSTNGVLRDTMQTEIRKISHNKAAIFHVYGVDEPDLDANIVAQKIAKSLEERASFRSAQKKAIKNARHAGAKGIRTLVGGRLGGADIARNEGYKDGIIPLHTLRSDIDFAIAEARTTYGRLGVKVWICRGNYKTKEELAKEAEQEKQSTVQHSRPNTSNHGERTQGGNK